MADTSKPHTITVRLTQEQRERLDRAAILGPYALSLTDIIARGIELAAQELEQMAAKKGGAS
jgi:ABC-type cobalamin transport system permease subunit